MAQPTSYDPNVIEIKSKVSTSSARRAFICKLSLLYVHPVPAFKAAYT